MTDSMYLTAFFGALLGVIWALRLLIHCWCEMDMIKAQREFLEEVMTDEEVDEHMPIPTLYKPLLRIQKVLKRKGVNHES